MRPRLSDEEKKQRGTYKPSRGSGDEIQDVMVLTAGDPMYPLGAEAMEYWRAITRQMAAYKILSEADIHTISRLCLYYDKWLECINKSMIDIDGMSGNMKQSAYFMNMSKLESMISNLEKQLALTPALRMKLRAPDNKKKDDPAAQFFK
jgi:P27 family predicted phage terminase small subunit